MKYTVILSLFCFLLFGSQNGFAQGNDEVYDDEVIDERVDNNNNKTTKKRPRKTPKVDENGKPLPPLQNFFVGTDLGIFFGGRTFFVGLSP